MKKVNLAVAADEFQMIDQELSVFYNTETGEFDFYADFLEDIDPEQYDEDCWIPAPRYDEIDAYSIMVRFTDSLKNKRAKELLSVALKGRGAFRRFKDTLHHLDLTDEWYAFQNEAYIEIAREWCEENDIPYENIPFIS